MKNQIYRPPDSDLRSDEDTIVYSGKRSLFKRFWYGEISLWKTILVVNIVGFIATFFIIAFIGFFVITNTKNMVAIVAINPIIFTCFGIYCIVSVWRSSSKNSSTLVGIIAKVWVSFFGLILMVIVLSGLIKVAAILYVET